MVCVVAWVWTVPTVAAAATVWAGAAEWGAGSLTDAVFAIVFAIVAVAVSSVAFAPDVVVVWVVPVDFVSEVFFFLWVEVVAPAVGEADVDAALELDDPVFDELD